LLGDASSKLSDSEKGFFEVGEDEPDHPLITGKKANKPAGRKAPKKKIPEPEQKKKPEPKQKQEPKSAPEPNVRKEVSPEPKPDSVPKQPAGPAVAAKKREMAGSAPASRKTSPKPTEAKSGRDPIMIVIGVVLIFIIIAAGFLIIPGLFEGQGSESNVNSSESNQSAIENTVPENEQAESAGNDTDEVPLETVEAPDRLMPPEPETEDAVTDNAGTEAEPVLQENRGGYGLRGSLNEGANNGFSIVLHSLRQEESARARAAELSTDGYRVLVSQRSVNGQNVWRVSVGQFETIADAQEAAQTLPSPYNSNNFIQRIQTN
jgi:septal ring-binding cell division protein DamX